MKSVFTAALVASAASTVAANGWGSAQPFPNPQNQNNQCSAEQKSGFDWSGLPQGNFNSFGGFSYSGFSCQNSFQGGRRGRLLRARDFSGKVIQGTAQKGSGSPSISCQADNKMSITSFDIATDFDTDMDFVYAMGDGSSCKHTASCSAGGSTVQNTQCGGAKSVTFQIPSSGKSSSCGFGIHSISFDCSPPQSPPPPATSSSTQTSTTTQATTTTQSTSSVTTTSSAITTIVSTTVLTSSTATSIFWLSSWSSSSSVSTSVPTSSILSTTGTSSSTLAVTTSFSVSKTTSYTCSTCSTTPSSSSIPTSSSTTTPGSSPVSSGTTSSAASSSSVLASTTSSATTSAAQCTSCSSPPRNAPNAPCPNVLPSCMNTWLNIAPQCKSNSDVKCLCPNPDYTKQIISCVSAWATDDKETQAALSYFAGICADFIPQNPGICTNVPSSITLQPTAPVQTAVVTQSGSTATVTVTQPVTTCTFANTVVSSGVTSTVTSVVTVPQVSFVTQQAPATTVTAGTTVTQTVVSVGLIPAMPQSVAATTTDAAPSSSSAAVAAVSASSSTTATSTAYSTGTTTVAIPNPSVTGPDVFQGAASKSQIAFGAIGGVLAVAAFLV